MARGRYMLGVGISALPGDLRLYDMDAEGGENRRRRSNRSRSCCGSGRRASSTSTASSGTCAGRRPLQVARSEAEGERRPSGLDFLGVHLKPYQTPHPPIGIAGLSAGSKTLELAGERGFLPLSISLNPAHTHHTGIRCCAARAHRARTRRREWRLVRRCTFAETDARCARVRARRRDGALLGEYLLPFYVGNAWART